MRYKENLEDAQRRIVAWMNCEPVDRPALVVTSPKEGVVREPFPSPASLDQQWLDIDYRLAQHEYWVEGTYYGGEAVPYIFINLGPGVLAAFLTGRLELDPRTVWFPKCVDRLEEILDLGLDEENRYWRFVREFTKASLEAGKDRWYTSITDIGGVSDVAASMRGNAAFLEDTITDRDTVERVIDHLCTLWIEVYDRLDGMTSAGQDGSASWMMGYAPSRQYPLQCDLAAMLSPQSFRDLIVPELRKLSARLDLPMYHLDGPDAVRHVDALLEMPEMRVIQWVPGAGAPHAVEWLEMLRKIQDGGKAIFVYAHGPDEVETLARELRPEGLMIRVEVDREETARELVEKLPGVCAGGEG
jgi:hypothetical protein